MSLFPPGWRSEPSEARPEIQQVVRDALACVGMRETSTANRGPEVDQWTGMVGEPMDETGPPWCMYFVSACYRAAEGGSPFGRIGSGYRLVEWARPLGRVLAQGADLVPGDVFVMARGDDGFHTHVGLVVGRSLDGVVPCVEGNHRNAVAATLRAVSSFQSVVRPLA